MRPKKDLVRRPVLARADHRSVTKASHPVPDTGCGRSAAVTSECVVLDPPLAPSLFSLHAGQVLHDTSAYTLPTTGFFAGTVTSSAVSATSSAIAELPQSPAISQVAPLSRKRRTQSPSTERQRATQSFTTAPRGQAAEVISVQASPQKMPISYAEASMPAVGVLATAAFSTFSGRPATKWSGGRDSVLGHHAPCPSLSGSRVSSPPCDSQISSFQLVQALKRARARIPAPQGSSSSDCSQSFTTID